MNFTFAVVLIATLCAAHVTDAASVQSNVAALKNSAVLNNKSEAETKREASIDLIINVIVKISATLIEEQQVADALNETENPHCIIAFIGDSQHVYAEDSEFANLIQRDGTQLQVSIAQEVVDSIIAAKRDIIREQGIQVAKNNAIGATESLIDANAGATEINRGTRAAAEETRESQKDEYDAKIQDHEDAKNAIGELKHYIAATVAGSDAYSYGATEIVSKDEEAAEELKQNRADLAAQKAQQSQRISELTPELLQKTGAKLSKVGLHQFAASLAQIGMKMSTSAPRDDILAELSSLLNQIIDELNASAADYTLAEEASIALFEALVAKLDEEHAALVLEGARLQAQLDQLHTELQDSIDAENAFRAQLAASEDLLEQIRELCRLKSETYREESRQRFEELQAIEEVEEIIKDWILAHVYNAIPTWRTYVSCKPTWDDAIDLVEAGGSHFGVHDSDFDFGTGLAGAGQHESETYLTGELEDRVHGEASEYTQARRAHSTTAAERNELGGFEAREAIASVQDDRVSLQASHEQEAAIHYDALATEGKSSTGAQLEGTWTD